MIDLRILIRMVGKKLYAILAQRIDQNIGKIPIFFATLTVVDIHDSAASRNIIRPNPTKRENVAPFS